MAIGMTLDCLRDLPHEGSVVDEATITFDGLSANEGDSVTGQDEMACLKGQGGTAWVWEAYV